MQKKKLLIVGSFPFLRSDYKSKKFYGGILKSSELLLDSSLSKEFNLLLIDSTHDSLNPPHFILKLLAGFKRVLQLIKFIIKVICLIKFFIKDFLYT